MKGEGKGPPSPAERGPLLIAARNLKMSQSAQAYVRGSTEKFYGWLDGANARRIPQGPSIWICGDCHVGNLGPLADCEGRIEVQMRDFDQTVVGNPAHDLLRLALSLASAARGSDLPGVTTARVLEAMMHGYEEALLGRAEKHRGSKSQPEPVKLILRRAMRRTWKHLARERLANTKPTIPRGKCFWPLSSREVSAIHRLFEDSEVHHLLSSLESRKDGDRIEVLDCAYWMKGCSSLGRLRFAVLVGVGKKDRDLCLIDIKEAVTANAPRSAGAHMPRDNGKRVIEGARHLAPYLGERMLAGQILGRPIAMRELLPQDLKLEFAHLSREDAIKGAHFLATTIGQAHSRQMDSQTRRAWRATLRHNRPKRLDAPGWLWSSVVDLLVSHEGAYLEHCRRHSLQRRVSGTTRRSV